jgi:hypothetical protein
MTAVGLLGPAVLGTWLLAALASGPPAPVNPTSQSKAMESTGQFHTLVLLREDPLAGSERFDLDASTRLLVHERQHVRPGCLEHWDRRCWEKTQTRRMLTRDQMEAIARAVAALHTTSRAAMASVGESSVQVVIESGEAAVRRALSTERDPQPAVVQLEKILRQTGASR